MIRRKRQSISVDVDVDLDDVLSEIDDDDLLAIIAERGISGPSLGCSEPEAKMALECLYRGDAAEAQLILERALFPKFPNLGACMSLFAKTKGGIA